MNKEEFYKMIKDEILEYMPEDFKEHTVRKERSRRSFHSLMASIVASNRSLSSTPII